MGTFRSLTVWCLCLVLVRIYAAPLRSSPHIKSVTGMNSFKSAIASQKLSFVKFFHPQCPHCQAMAQDFIQLAELVAAQKQKTGASDWMQVSIIEVDASVEANHPVMQVHADSFPTLKLFRNGSLLAEYNGARKAGLMDEFLERSLQLAKRPLISHLQSDKDLSKFLKLTGERPVLISLFQPKHAASVNESKTTALDFYPEHIHLHLDEWHETVSLMNTKTGTQTVFATVPHPDLLVPAKAMERFRRASAAHAVPPLLAAAAAADSFDSTAEWYFPGVRDGDPPSSFMHTAIVPRDEYITLRKENLPYILESTRPLALGFGIGDSPGYYEDSFLRTAASPRSTPALLSAYASVNECTEFAEYLGINVSQALLSREKQEKWTTRYVIYRFGNHGPISNTFIPNNGTTAEEWLMSETKIINGTKVATTAGSVLELDTVLWKNFVEFDGRGSVVEVYKSSCTSCGDLKPISDRVAGMLKAYAGWIVVARVDVAGKKAKELPISLDPFHPPAFWWIAPGEKPTQYEGPKSASHIARFAMEMGGIQEGSVGWVDVLAAHFLLWGIILVLAGIALGCRSKFIIEKRMHVN